MSHWCKLSMNFHRVHLLLSRTQTSYAALPHGIHLFHFVWFVYHWHNRSVLMFCGVSNLMSSNSILTENGRVHIVWVKI
jgi:hypothetical protein